MNNSIFDYIDKFLDKDLLELSKKRMDICNTCPNFNTVPKKCNLCGCYMEAKTRLRNAACPIEKW